MRFNDVGIDHIKDIVRQHERKFGITSSLFHKLTLQGIKVVDDVAIESEWLFFYEWIVEGENESRPFHGQADRSGVGEGNCPLLLCMR